MRAFLCSCMAMAVIGTASAQDQKWLNLQGEVRIDYQHEHLDGNAIKANSGFKGKYINIIMNGQISDAFSYSYRQRLNKAHSDQSFFDATDWIYLTYKANDNWSIAGGKQVVAIGGYEYDRAPIDLYFCSEFWNNVPCYALGASVTYATKSGNDKFTAQVCESPFNMKDENMFAYNLMWSGSHDWFNSLYSVNALEYRPGKFIYYLALGNEFKLGNAKLQLDFMNRATAQHTLLFKDCSLMGELSCPIGKHINIFGKVTYDVNRSGKDSDYTVHTGTELTRVGGGLEYYPLSNGNRNVRLHANFCYSWGTNSNKYGAMLPKQSIVDVGVKWKVDILSFTRKIASL